MAREADLSVKARTAYLVAQRKGNARILIVKGLVRSRQVGRATSRKLSVGFVGNHIYITYKCWNNPDRKVASSANIVDDEGRLVSASSADTSRPQFQGNNSLNRGRGNYRGRGYGRGNNRGQGRGVGSKFDNATR